jgi:DNA-binding LytR/AlgR family response regulator
MYAEAWGNYIKIYLTGQQQRLVVYESLATLLTKLDPAKFVQVHRSYLINRDYLTQVTPNWLLLKGGQQVPVGRKFQILLT